MAADNSAIDPIDPVGPLADEFLARHRRGEQPTIADYIERYPEHAERIKQLFPMLLTMEEAGADQSLGATVAPGTPVPEWSGPHLDRIGGYRLLREIGRGGMGIVYEAEQTALGRHVALKVLPLHAARDGSGLERFRQEAKAAARLHHTNIVPVFEVGQDGDAYFYAMQFIVGQPLDQVLDEVRKLRAASLGRPVPPGASVAHSLITGPITPPPTPSRGADATPLAAPPESRLSLRERTPFRGAKGDTAAYYKSVARVGVQVAQALDYAHKEGVIHRDVKPSNLLLDADGRVWITDFGLAKTDNSALTQTGDVVGTIRYMAPERFNGWSDPRSDVYALGLTLYEMLALRPAFDAEEQGKLMQQVLHQEPPRLRKVDLHVPRDVETIIAKAIDKEPSRRYQTAAELGADLQRFLEDRPIQARRIGSLERAWRWSKRNPALAAATVLTFAALLTATVVSVLFAAAKADSAAEQKRLGDDLRLALSQSKDLAAERDKALKETRGHAAHSAIHRSQSLLERGQVHEAMLWLTRALELAPEDDADVQHYARTSLASLEADAPILQTMWAPQHPAPVATAAFSADGTLILTGSEAAEGGASEARLWEAMTGKPLTDPLPHEGNITLAAISPDGEALLTASSSQPGHSDIRIWDRATGRQMTTEPISYTGSLTALVCGPKGTTFFTLGNPKPEEPAEVWFWQVADGTVKSRPLVHGGPVTALALSPKGDALCTAWHLRTSTNGGLRLWDARTGEPGEPTALLGEVTALAFDAEGSVRAAIDTGTISAWNPKTKDLHFTLYEARGTVRGLTLSPARDFALVVAENIQTGRSEARLWDLYRGRGLGVALPTEANPGRTAFGPDGRHVLTWHPRQPVRVWDLDFDRRWLAAVPVPPSPNGDDGNQLIQYSADGRSLLTVAVAYRSSAARRWDTEAGTVQGQPLYVPKLIYSWAASPDGRTYLLAEQREARFWDVVAGKSVGPRPSFRSTSHHIAFNPSGTTVALTDAERLWLVDVAGGEATGPAFPRPGPLLDLRFSPDGKELWLTAANSIRCLNVVTGKDAASRVAVRGRGFHGVVLDPTGHWLAVLDQTGVALWDRTTGQRAEFFVPRSRGMNAVVFTPDGKGLVTPDPSGWGAQLWDVAVGKPIGLSIHCPSLFRGAQFRPDGGALALGGSTGVVRLVRMPKPAEGDAAQLGRRARALSGLELTAAGDVYTRAPATWQAEAGAAAAPPSALPWHLRRGLDRFEVGQWDAALWHLDRRLSEQPDDWLALALRARALAQLDRLDDAAADFDRSFEKGPAETVYAWHLLATHGSSLFNDPIPPVPGKPTKTSVADWFLKRLLARDTRETGAILQRRAQNQGFLNHWDKAVADDERAARLMPDDSDLLMELGYAYVMNNQRDRAGATFIKAAEASAEDADVWHDTAIWLVRLEQWDKAAEHFLHALDLQPQGETVGAPRAKICLEMARKSEVYERAVKRRPKDSQLMTGRARYHVERGEWKEAAADFARVVELEDFEERYYEYAAVLLLIPGEEAAYHKWVARMVEKAGNSDKADWAYVLARACVLAPKSDIDPARAVAWAEKALAAMPDAGWRLHILGLALYRKGDYPGAIARLEQAERSNWGAAPVLDQLALAMAHYKHHDEKEARKYLEQATDLMDKRAGSQPFTAAYFSTDVVEAILLRREADELILGKNK